MLTTFGAARSQKASAHSLSALKHPGELELAGTRWCMDKASSGCIQSSHPTGPQTVTPHLSPPSKKKVSTLQLKVLGITCYFRNEDMNF